MGCLGCRPKTAVTEDPDVVLYSLVGKTAMFNKQGSTMLSSSYHSILYVKDRELCFENALGSRLCCEHLKMGWPLVEIKQIKVMEGERLRVSRPGSAQTISLNPGLKVIFQDAQGNCQTLMISMPYNSVALTENFSTQLRQCVDAAST